MRSPLSVYVKALQRSDHANSRAQTAEGKLISAFNESLEARKGFGTINVWGVPGQVEANQAEWVLGGVSHT
jgi:hypothetical protein